MCHYKPWNNWQCDIAAWHECADRADDNPSAQRYRVAVANEGKHCLVARTSVWLTADSTTAGQDCAVPAVRLMAQSWNVWEGDKKGELANVKKYPTPYFISHVGCDFFFPLEEPVPWWGEPSSQGSSKAALNISTSLLLVAFQIYLCHRWLTMHASNPGCALETAALFRKTFWNQTIVLMCLSLSNSPTLTSLSCIVHCSHELLESEDLMFPSSRKSLRKLQKVLKSRSLFS